VCEPTSEEMQDAAFPSDEEEDEDVDETCLIKIQIRHKIATTMTMMLSRLFLVFNYGDVFFN